MVITDGIKDVGLSVGHSQVGISHVVCTYTKDGIRHLVKGRSDANGITWDKAVTNNAND